MKKINFFKYKKIILLISLILCIISIKNIFIKKINFGIEFSGGMELEFESDSEINLKYIKKILKNNNDIKIRYYGSSRNIIIGIKKDKNQNIFNEIKEKLPKNIKLVKYDYIGTEINKDIINKTIISFIVSVFFMFIYLTYRFEFYMAVSAIIALFHDIIILIGFISILKIEINLITISAIFTIFGYSINDTVVIFDRIREYKEKYKNTKNTENIVNHSINSTLSRTLTTSLSTLLVTLILIIFSGEYIYNFAIILSFGIIVGTYSSIYISTILIINKSKF